MLRNGWNIVLRPRAILRERMLQPVAFFPPASNAHRARARGAQRTCGLFDWRMFVAWRRARDPFSRRVFAPAI